MSPGALLLGNPGACFQCGHEHATGDRCLSFHLDPASVETIAADIPGARLPFDRASLPPAASFAGLMAAAVTARDDGDAGAMEEVALRLTGAVLASLGAAPRPAPASRRDERAVTAAVRHMEAHADEPLTLAALAAQAAMSRYHFLRVFRRAVGLTPHQYLLRLRLHRAALALRRGEAPVASVAFDAGFNDLSTFHRRFRRLMGVSPARYRSRRSC
jgi:AraC-like DNA-binding protein